LLGCVSAGGLSATTSCGMNDGGPVEKSPGRAISVDARQTQERPGCRARALRSRLRSQTTNSGSPRDGGRADDPTYIHGPGEKHHAL
jgi:hypothetical protein